MKKLAFGEVYRTITYRMKGQEKRYVPHGKLVRVGARVGHETSALLLAWTAEGMEVTVWKHDLRKAHPLQRLAFESET